MDEIDSIGSSRLEGGSGGKENLLLIILCREIVVQWNLSNLTQHSTREMCQIVQDVGILGFILFNRNTLEPEMFVGCHRMSEHSGIGLHMFHCIWLLMGFMGSMLTWDSVIRT
jgi:hypothetical protein